jgi:hypothetical protein
MTRDAQVADAVSMALTPYRSRLAEDASDFTDALLALAAANAKGTAGFNAPSPQDAVVLHALGRWRRDASHALKRVEAVPAGAPGRDSAIRWLKSSIAGLDLQRLGLSLVDPAAAADAARRAALAAAKTSRLEARLDKEIA